MRKITAGELSKILKEHKRWYDTDGEEGEKANLSETNLEGSKLYGANLREADLSDACLEGVEGLTKASLIEKPSKVVINREKVIKDNFIIGG